MIDPEWTGPTEPRRKGPMRVLVAAIVAAAAVVAIAFVVSRADDATPADQPSPTVTVPPTTPPQALFAPPDGPPCTSPGPCIERLVPGTYFVDEVDGTPTPRIFFTIGAGWQPPNYMPSSNPEIYKAAEIYKAGVGVRDGGGGFIAFSRPARRHERRDPIPGDRVFSDACHWSDGYHPGPVDTVDGFVAALSEQRGWADVTGPSDISIDGYVGKAFQRTAPADVSDCDIVADFTGRLAKPGGTTTPAFHEGAYEPGSIETVWVLDIDGTVVVINTVLEPLLSTLTVAIEGPPAGIRAEVAAVLDSIRIDRG